MKKRILMFVANPAFDYGNPNSAVAVYLKTLRDSLVAAHFEVVLYPPEKKGTGDLPVSGKSKLSALKQVVRKIFPGLYAGLLAKKQVQSATSAMQQLLEEKDRFDLVIEFLTLGSEAGATISKQAGIPLVTIYDSPLLEQFEEMYGTASFMKGRIEQAEKRSIQAADVVLCYSNPVRAHLEKLYGKKTGVHVMPCIVWKGAPAIKKDNEPRIGFIGSFLKWHKVDILVEAFGQLTGDYPAARLVLVGYGQEWERIRRMVDDGNLRSRIEMTGFVSEEQLTAIKSGLLIGVMPGSNWYGSPLKLFEYAESGIAIIAPVTPTVKDLFAETEVVFIDPAHEVESLKNGLKLLLDNEQHRNSLVQAARNKMQTTCSKSQQLSNFNQIISNTFQRGSKA